MVLVYDKIQKKVVPINERLDKPTIDRSRACHDSPFIVCDIEPYQGIGFRGSPMVTSRSQHRELLRAHGAQEVGNEQPEWMKERKYEREHGRKD